MSLDETKEEDDTLVEVNGINFLLDPQAHKFASGATVDYSKTIFGSGFTVKSARGGNC
ncbi:MAG: hypothetical protein QM401_06430 [Bacillota bacterium]|nr:hypothetical protein [Bacillota bacterium]HHU60678.1 hypothetical protein [Natronincola sp.]